MCGGQWASRVSWFSSTMWILGIQLGYQSWQQALPSELSQALARLKIFSLFSAIIKTFQMKSHGDQPDLQSKF